MKQDASVKTDYDKVATWRQAHPEASLSEALKAAKVKPHRWTYVRNRMAPPDARRKGATAKASTKRAPKHYATITSQELPAPQAHEQVIALIGSPDQIIAALAKLKR